jgi:alpha-beta hydrolase superfamily lysophospholipase
LPIFIFSGSEDPVGQQLEGVRTLIGRYRKAGVHNITHKFYVGGRHEMLNEINRDEVQADLLGWILAAIETKANHRMRGASGA